jgi:serine/threonine protein kinase/tetratricopeptide (TPR) repeat protein
VSTEPIFFGRYQLLSMLARGGMGEVWRARSLGVEGFEKALVIKRILPELSVDTHFVEMFIDEAKLALTLTHANIVQVFDLGLFEDTYFIAMEHVPGWDLARLLHMVRGAGRTLPAELAVFIASEVAKALDYAHRRRSAELVPLGIVHRDVSPENVLLSFEGEVKLADFGIAKSRDSVVSPLDLPPGKFAYMAPEQARQEALDARADIFALGAVLFEMLTGKSPLACKTAMEGLEGAANGRHRRLSELLPDASPELCQVLERAMSPDRSLRHVSASELYEDLIQVLYGSGRRVGSLDLAKTLSEYGKLADQEALRFGRATSGLEHLFDEGSGAMASPIGARTPVRLPPRSGSSNVPAALSKGNRPRPEWREVSVLAASASAQQAIVTAAQRFGGEGFPHASPSVPLVIFGLGDADGRDALAAARCALQLAREQEGNPLCLVLHCGRLLVDAEGRPHHAASLHALRTEAIRLLRRAEARLAVSPQAAKHLRGRFELAPAGVEGLRPLVRELAADEGLGKFVGRREELRAIGEAFATAHRGALRVLGLRGDAGAGKSRLVVETLRRLRHAGHDVTMHIANCGLSPHGLPLGSVQQLVRVILGLDERDAEVKVQEHVEHLRQLGLSSAQRDAVARLMGLRPSAGGIASTAQLESALLRIAYKLAQDQLTVFVWDGAEQMDPASRELVQRLARMPLRARVVVLLAYRPNGQPLIRSERFDEIRLQPLSKDDVGRLIRHRLLVPDLPDGLVEDIWSMSEGNPLFAEELLTTMRDSHAIEVDGGAVHLRRGARTTELPRTLRGLVATRVGRLSQSQRFMLQVAVTIGAQFTPELVAAASQLEESTVRQGLAVLEERGIVRAGRPGEYAFAHELVREALYGSISAEDRPVLHGAVANAIEALRPAEQDAQLERLAYHHREAGDPRRATSYLVRAAEQFEQAQAHERALATYMQSITLLSQDEEPDANQLLRLYGHVGELAFRTHSAEAVADLLAVALELAEHERRDDLVARFAMIRGRLLSKASRFQEGRVWLERAHEVAQARGDRGLERDVALAAAEAHARNGEYRSVIPYVAEALALARATDDLTSQLRALVIGTPAYAAIGDHSTAIQQLQELAILSSGNRDHLLQVELARVGASVFFELGELDRAVDAAREAMELARDHGFIFEHASLAFTYALYCLRAGDERRAFPALRQSYELATEHGFARLQWLNVCLLGYVDIVAFGAESSRPRMLQAISYAEERGLVEDIIVEKLALAAADQKLALPAEARQALREVHALAQLHGHLGALTTAERQLAEAELVDPIRAAQ